MPRFWVIAPYESANSDQFDKVWNFDLENNVISIGWDAAGDISKLDREGLSNVVASAYPEKPLATRSLYCNMLWAFYHDIAPGDFIIARRGRKIIAGAGRVVSSAEYLPGTSPAADHPNFLRVDWKDQPRDKSFASLVFPMHTLSEIKEGVYRDLVEGSGAATVISELSEQNEGIDQSAFVLEKYLEDFIVSNFGTIFKGKLKVYVDEEGANGQQYQTDIGYIDILAVDPATGSFVVVELKKGRPSDQVIGQVLRYMGWVKKNLCTNGHGVRGLVICRDEDLKLSYAVSMTSNIDVRYYKVHFDLLDAPPLATA